MDDWVKLNQPGEQTSSALMGNILLFSPILISVSLLGKELEVIEMQIVLYKLR